MEFFRIHKTIPFMRHKVVLNLISLIVFLAAVFFIATRGFHLSIEFTGGTVMEVNYPQAAQLDEVRGTLANMGYTDFQVQNFGTSRDVMIRLPVSEGQDAAQQSQKVMAALQTAEAAVALAEARLQKMTIRAPLSGVIGLRSVSVGAYVTPGQAIVELADIDPLKLEFRVPELALPSLRQGQPLRVTVDALPGRSYEGTIDAIDPIVDASGRAIRMRARIPNPSGELSPGLFARVALIVDRRENAILVPESAVFAQGRQHYVYRVVDRHARLTGVELGTRRPGLVEVRSGLDRDDLVVSAGHQQLRDGGRVDILAPGAGA